MTRFEDLVRWGLDSQRRFILDTTASELTRLVAAVRNEADRDGASEELREALIDLDLKVMTSLPQLPLRSES